MNINKNIISFVLFSSLLTACSGGGGGGSSNSDAPNKQPIVAQPVPQAPAAEAPAVAAPAPQAPAAEAPAVVAPAPQAPAAEAPAVVAPAPQAPAAEAPAVVAPAPQAPAVQDVAIAPGVQMQGLEIPAAEVKPLEPKSFQLFQTEYAEVTKGDPIKHRTTFGLDPNGQFHVKLSGQDLVVEADEFKTNDPRDNRVLLDHNLQALRDVDGTLLGYYGRVTTQTHFEDVMDEDDIEKITDTYVYSMDTEKRRLPEATADYRGKVYYNKHDLLREADISLHYEDRMVTGDIKGTTAGLNSDLHYVLNNNGDVEDDGSFSATMRHHYEREGSMSGVINGGFYGEGGAIAVGDVSLDIDPTNGAGRSAGVFGAKRVNPAAGK
ncbi:hypothetical protein [Plesiomonas shigelloides]|uniref:hypothetical protein n=1 Tax=Plesiomonas shigelloides TaxID=703 RepID=UPI00387F20DF